jgi:hypothetical protein
MGQSKVHRPERSALAYVRKPESSWPLMPPPSTGLRDQSRWWYPSVQRNACGRSHLAFVKIAPGPLFTYRDTYHNTDERRHPHRLRPQTYTVGTVLAIAS